MKRININKKRMMSHASLVKLHLQGNLLCLSV